MELKKKCTKCGEEKPFINFCKRKSSKDGLAYVCKDCQKQYKEANPEKFKAIYEKIKFKYKYQPHEAEKQKEAMKEWRKKNPDKIRTYNRMQKEKRRDKKSESFL
jgi:hypothetical protein